MADNTTRLFRSLAVQPTEHVIPHCESVCLPPDLRRYSLITVLLVFFGLWLLTQAEYAEKVTVAGRLADGTTELFASRSGVISTVHVAVGDRVRAGDPLIEIETLRAGGVDRRKQAHLDQLITEERKEISSLIAIAFSQRKTEAASITRRLQALRREQRYLGSQERLLVDEVERQQSLVENTATLLRRGMIAQVESDRAATALQRAKSAALANTIRIAKTESEVKELGEELLIGATALEQKLAQLTLELLATDRRLYEFHAAREQSVVADFDGVVAQVLVGRHETVDVDTPLVSLRPEGRPTLAKLYLHPQALEVARVGSTVRLRYDAYPYRKYGLFEGTIIELSETGVPTGNDTSSMFVAKASVHEATTQDGTVLPLRDDMTLTADLPGETRRVIDWLLNPILGVWKRSGT